MPSGQVESSLYGAPTAGRSGSLLLTAADQSIVLVGPGMAQLTAVGGDLLYGQADATAAANPALLLAGVSCAFMIPSGGLTLHVTQGPVAGGTVYYSVST